MTSTLPAPIAVRITDAPSETRRLRAMREARPGAREDGGTAPLVGYLLLVPEGTDPAELISSYGTQAEIHPVARTGEATPLPPLPAGDGIRVDPVTHTAEADGRPLGLTYLEFELLAYLVAHPERVHRREHLVARIWGYDHTGDRRTVDVHIARLRRKLGAAYRGRIVTVRRVGYRYVPARPQSATRNP